MNFHILTLFPEMVMNGLNTSITGRAIQQGKIDIEAINIRDFSKNKHHKVDDYPYGGGAGMLMQAQPVFDAYQSVAGQISEEKRKRVIYVTPQGTPFSQEMAENFAKNDELIFLCGHYEGIDERVLEEVVTDYVSIGDYVLTGGELAAMVMIDAISRLVPGVLNNEVSAETESFHQNLLEYPQYSRPEIWHEKEVPKVLLSGNQKKIDEWRIEESEKRTKERRPDLYAQYEQLQDCKISLMKQKLVNIDMIEQINRGRAELILQNDDNILIRDKKSNIYYYSAPDIEKGIEAIKNFSKELVDDMQLLVLHQKELVAPVEALLGNKLCLECYQMVYTKKEQLSLSGLYRNDGKEHENGIQILPLEEKDVPFICEHYTHMDDEAYIRERVIEGPMFGAFYHGKLAGFIGMHDEGSIGMLEVLPEYRLKHIGKALETYMINYSLQLGWIPYGQVVVGNDGSMKLQTSLGLYASKTPVYWVEK